MDRFTTVATFYSLPNLAILKGRLETEGIECFVKDEYVMQTNSPVSNAIGGIKLQVKTEDVEKAFEILKELGYIENEAPPTETQKVLDKATSQIPFLKKLNVESRILAIVMICLAIIMVVAIIKNR